LGLNVLFMSFTIPPDELKLTSEIYVRPISTSLSPNKCSELKFWLEKRTKMNPTPLTLTHTDERSKLFVIVGQKLVPTFV